MRQSLVIVATFLILGMFLTGRKQRQHKLLLTITGDSKSHLTDDESGVFSVLSAVAGRYTLQRFEVENGRSQVRIVLGESNPQKTADLIKHLHKRLPNSEISYVNLNSTL